MLHDQNCLLLYAYTERFLLGMQTFSIKENKPIGVCNKVIWSQIDQKDEKCSLDNVDYSVTFCINKFKDSQQSEAFSLMKDVDDGDNVHYSYSLERHYPYGCSNLKI